MSSVYVAAIDVHKNVLMVVVGSSEEPEQAWRQQRFGTIASEIARLIEWLKSFGVEQVAMESTAVYWWSVWRELEGQFRLLLAQPRSTQAPRGRKSDFGDAVRIVKRLLAGDLTLSYVPDREQRKWRLLTRMRTSLVSMKVIVRNRLEGVLEDARLKPGVVFSDVVGVSGRRILKAIADGKTDPAELAELADFRVKASKQEIREALTGKVEPEHKLLIQAALDHLALLDRQITELDTEAAKAMRAHQETIERLSEVPGVGPEAALQIVAELGPTAAAFASANKVASWVAVCPGRNESAEKSRSKRSAKGNRPMRRLLSQMALGAVQKKGCIIGVIYRRWLPRMGHNKAIWAIAHKLLRIIWKVLHNGVRYQEPLAAPLDERLRKSRKQRYISELRRLGYEVKLSDLHPNKGLVPQG